MSFEAPLFLLGLLAVPVAIALYLRFGRRTATFAAVPVMPSVTPRRPGWRRHAPAAVYGIAATALVVALARPQATIAVAVEQATVVVVTDRSGSMLAEDVAPDRLRAARKAASTFLAAVPDDVKVGAVAFNHTAQVIQSPTRDHEAVQDALDGVKAAGSTATGDALQAALELIDAQRRASGKKSPAAVVLLSDGKSVRGSDPLDAADAAKAAGVPVYTVALGTPGGTIQDGRVPVPPDPATLRSIAERTGGRSFAAGDAERLAQVYERLGSEVATEKRKREVTGAFDAGALLLMAGAAAASVRWFGRFL